jgi:hypothetical protein
MHAPVQSDVAEQIDAGAFDQIALVNTECRPD